MSTLSSSPSPNQKHFKFMFQANVKTVSLALKFPCVVSVIWKRGQKAQQVKQRKPIQKGIIAFNQTLQIQCNMVFDMVKKVFEQKKTKFTILIFSQKGNKQAGQVYIDVAQLLNTKQKIIQYQKPLQKCPDKNAKLSFSLQCYMKQEITADMVSQRSKKQYDMQATLNKQVSVINTKPDFKKKKKQVLVNDQDKVREQNIMLSTAVTKVIRMPLKSNSNEKRRENNNNDTVQSLMTKKTTNSNSNNSNNLYTQSFTKLQQQNKILKQQLKQLKQLQFQNQNLKRKYQEADKKAQSYYKKKYQQMKQQYNQLKQKNQQITLLAKKKDQLEFTYCQCKQTIGKIFNYAIMTGNDRLMEMMEALE